MELYVQMGHAMQGLALDLLGENGPKTQILSPINMTESSMESHSKKVLKGDGALLIDPQLYYPRKYHKNLVKYKYFPKDGATLFENGVCSDIIYELSRLNDIMSTCGFILPAYTEKRVDDRWNRVQQEIARSARKCTKKLLYQTIALSSDLIMDTDQVQQIVGFAESWESEGVYIVCEHPDKYYLVEKPLWVSNLMELVASLKRQGKKVIVGYASHQLLCLSLAKCDAIASGNFLNLRWFKPDRFETNDEANVSQRSTWYYCPQALSEFKIPFLDIAKRMNILDRMRPSPDTMTSYCEILFGAALPTATAYSEKEAFRHYLLALHKQCQAAVRSTYSETLSAHLLLLQTAEGLLKGLRDKGIRGQDRDFGDIIDVNRAAVAAFDMAYGAAMKNEWPTL